MQFISPNSVVGRVGHSQSRRQIRYACTRSSLKPAMLIASLLILISGILSPSVAQDIATEVKIGVMTDMSGMFSDYAGAGSVVAANLAVEEFGGKVAGMPVKILSFDHQNNPDIASVATRRWLDEGVSMVIDYPTSSTALAAQEIARQRKRIIIYSAAGAATLTGKACSPYGFQWMYDTYSNSIGLIKPLAARGLDSFFFVTVDYALGTSLEADFRRALQAANLRVVGSVKFPFNSSDLSSPILLAGESTAKAIVIASGGSDMINAVKAAQEFHLPQSGKTLVTPFIFLTDIRALGLETAQGLLFVESFYWNFDERSRAFAQRFYARHHAMPTVAQAGVYSATRHYLQAVEATKSLDADEVAAKMREMPIEDAVVRHGWIRVDGRVMKDMYLAQAKSPSQSTAEWDLENILATIPAEDAFKPLSESDCPLVRR